MQIEQALFISSDTDLPNSNIAYKSSDGSRVTISYNPPLYFPDEGYNYKAYLVSFNFWYTFVNVSASKSNNKFYFTNDVLDSDKYEITIDDGLYSLDALSAAIQYGIKNLSLTQDIISLTGDDSTGKVILNVKTGYQVYFKSTSLLRDLLGFTSNQLVPNSGLAASDISQKAPNVANFSNLSSILVHTSLISKSNFNGSNSDVLAVTTPQVGVGENQDYSPVNLVKVPCNNLKGISLSEASFYITDQNNTPLNTNSESFQLCMIIEYQLPDPK